MGIFAILFGTRHIDTTEHQDGMILAIAVESIVKLLAFLRGRRSSWSSASWAAWAASSTARRGDRRSPACSRGGLDGGRG